MRHPRSGDVGGARACIAAFLLLALPVSLWFALKTPLGDVADEPAHLMRAAALLDGQIVGHRETVRLPDGRAFVAAGVTVDPVWKAMSRSRDPADVSRPADPPPDPALGSGPWDATRRFEALYTIGTYFPAFYAPGALGLAAGRLTGASPREAAILGRLAATLAYAGLAVAALALARRGRLLLLATLALPMSLSLGGSFNHDGLIIAAACLAAALLSRSWDDAPGAPRRPASWLAAALIALIVLAKPPYAPLAVLLLPPLRRPGLPLRASLMALAVLPGVLWAGFTVAHVATPVPRAAYEAGPLWPGPRPAVFAATDPQAQFQVLAAAPARIATLPAGYLFTLKHALWLGRTGIGLLGWLDRPLPTPLYPLWALGLVGALLAGGRARDGGWVERGGLLLLAALACLWGILLSQYLTWTHVGEPRIDGPQGRYLLPLMPLMLPLLASGGAGAPWRRAAGWLPILAAGAGLALVPALMRL